MEKWQLRVSVNRQEVYVTELTGTAILGRQDKGQREEGPFWKKEDAGVWRVVIAAVEEDSISRRQLQVEPLPKGKCRLTNLGKQNLLVNGVQPLNPAASCEAAMPALLALGGKSIRIQACAADDPGLQSLSGVTFAPGSKPLDEAAHFTVSLPLDRGMEAEALIRWIQALLEVLQSAAGSSDFFTRAARAVVDLAGLDSGRVLLLEQGEWKEQAVQTAPRLALEPWQPSHQVLGKVLEEKRTFWQIPGSATQSLVGVKAVVAAPILDRHGKVIGALYGERRRQSSEISARPIAKLEAMLVEVLASGVAAGLARVEEEKAALRTRVQFEQFFSPNLARQLADNPALLKGRNSEVSILFCDIRGFSRISERLGPAGTTQWVSDIMESLSECVWEQEGVVLEYVGDEIRGMWGAPDHQPEHARQACRAGLAMLGRVPKLSAFWQPVLGEPLKLGVGIHSGSAWVGNVGSQRKFKYGPQGNTINLASRVQGATKYLKVNLLITKDTQAQLDAGFASRRLCRVRVVNIAQPVDLYELVEAGLPGWTQLKEGYEQALDNFEKKSFSQAAHLVSKLLLDYPHDGPSLILMSRIVQALVEDSADFDPIWELPGK